MNVLYYRDLIDRYELLKRKSYSWWCVCNIVLGVLCQIDPHLEIFALNVLTLLSHPSNVLSSFKHVRLLCSRCYMLFFLSFHGSSWHWKFMLAVKNISLGYDVSLSFEYLLFHSLVYNTSLSLLLLIHFIPSLYICICWSSLTFLNWWYPNVYGRILNFKNVFLPKIFFH